MHFCIFNLSCYALLKANVYIFQSCTWLLTLFPTYRFSTQNQEFQRVLLVVLLYCSIFKISFTVVFDSFYILSHLFVFVKPFFSNFFKFFLRLVFRLDVTFIYCITFLSVCQALFQDFFDLFFQAFLTAHVTAYLYYHFLLLLSTLLYWFWHYLHFQHLIQPVPI